MKDFLLILQAIDAIIKTIENWQMAADQEPSEEFMNARDAVREALMNALRDEG